MSEEDHDTDRPDDHLEDVNDGCGCVETWQHLSEQRESDDE
jgi:hypothetical protein